MIRSLLLPLFSLAALAGGWSERPIEPKARSFGTAYTVERSTWSLGLVNQEFGLLDNFQVGVTTPLWALGVPNVHGKVDAIQTKRLDIALDGGIYRTGLARFGVPEGSLLVTPVGFTASGLVTRRLSIHGGAGWTIARADGRLTPVQIAQGIQAATGANIRKDLEAALGTGGGVYAGADLTLYQTRLAADWRFNRRDSLVLQSNTWVWLSGLAAAGVAVDDGQGTEVNVGASARLRVPLTDTLPSLTTLSWQFDWRRVNLRLGIPLPLTNTFAWFQAVDLKWMLGPARSKDRMPPIVPEVPQEVESDTDTGREPSDTGREPEDDDTGHEAPDTGHEPSDTGAPE